MIYASWGVTFYFAWFSIISNMTDVDNMRKTIGFNIVTGAIYTVPIFFFCSGFLQTYAFMQKVEAKEMNLSKYYFRKVFRYMPLNIASGLLLVKILPYAGNGPVWNNFATLVEPCNDKFWTNVLWINNLYPKAYDDRCMPWTWFAPCYIQLSLLLPIFVMIYNSFENKKIIGGIYTMIAIVSIIINYMFVYSKNMGGTLVMNDDFYAEVFSSPIFQFPSFFYGILNCLIYLRYKNNRLSNSQFRNSFSSRALEMI